jgi:hypothetical protein
VFHACLYIGLNDRFSNVLLCTNGVLDVVDFFGNGCEKFPLPLGHGLLASSGGSQSDLSISTNNGRQCHWKCLICPKSLQHANQLL